MRKPCGRTSRKSLWWKVLDDLLKLSNRLTKTLFDREKWFAVHIFWLEELMEVGLMIAPTSRWSSMIRFPDVFWARLSFLHFSKPSAADVRKWRAPTNSMDFAPQLDREFEGQRLLKYPKGGSALYAGILYLCSQFSKQFLQSFPTTQKIPKNLKCFPQMSILNNSR